MGTIYLGRRADEEFEKQVAVKILKRGTDTEEVLRRFRAERQILAQLEHPNIARLIDAGTSPDGLPYFVMEYVDGVPITAYAEAANLSIRQRIELYEKVCGAIHFAHQNLVVHRDLKPGNILITPNGEPKLLDFGIAKLLSAGGDFLQTTIQNEQRFTPAYASPEQIRGDPVTTASDIYSLGALLYHLLTGEPPHRFKSEHPSPTEMFRVIVEQEPLRASAAAANRNSKFEIRKFLRGDLDNILSKALQKEPAQRYSSVTDFAEDLRRSIDGRPVRARPATFSYRASRFIGRNKVALAFASIVLLAIGGGMTAYVVQARRVAFHAQREAAHFRDLRQLSNSFLFEFHDAIKDLPGATVARQLVVSRAVEYLDKLARESGHDRALQLELAQAYLRIGDVQGQPYAANLGDAAGAIRSYGKAIDIVEPLVGRRPDATTTAAAQVLANACANLAGVQSRMSQLDLAKRNNSRALEIAERLVQQDPVRANEWRALIVTCEIGLGDAIEAGNHREEDPVLFRRELEHYRRALAISEELFAAAPDSLTELWRVAKSRFRVAAVLAELGAKTDDAVSFDECFALHDSILHLRETALAREPGNVTIRRNIADELVMTAYAHALARRDLDAGLAKCARALEIEKPLAAADFSNLEAQQDLGFAHYVNGRLFQTKGDNAMAAQSYTVALEILEPLVRMHPDNVETAFDRERIQRGLAEVRPPVHNGK